MLSSALTTGSSPVQGPLWSRRAPDWAAFQEPQCAALYDIILKALAAPRDTWLLDAGCGSGVFCARAAQKGLHPIGLDASPALLEIARKRAPTTTFFEGDLEELPFVDHTFEVVTALNSLPHCTSPLRALLEMRRVLRDNGLLVIATWSRPERCSAAAFFRAVEELLPVNAASTPAPFGLSREEDLSRLLAKAGLQRQLEAEAVTSWEYPDEDSAIRGLLSAGPVVRAIELAGESRVTAIAQKFLEPYRLARGGYRMENTFRYIVTRRP